PVFRVSGNNVSCRRGRSTDQDLNVRALVSSDFQGKPSVSSGAVWDGSISGCIRADVIPLDGCAQDTENNSIVSVARDNVTGAGGGASDRDVRYSGNTIVGIDARSEIRQSSRAGRVHANEITFDRYCIYREPANFYSFNIPGDQIACTDISIHSAIISVRPANDRV